MKPYITLLASLVFFSQALWGQTVVNVSPGNGTLNDAIQNYIDNNGSVDQSVVFELEDGGVYVLSATIDFDYDLNIQAAANAAVRPVILPIPATGGETFRPFRIRENIILRGLYITTEDALGGQSDQIIRISNDGAQVIIDNCHLDKATQSAIRIDNADNKIYVTNSVFSNVWNLPNPSNGRAFDDRGQDIDTLWVENSTFYNFSARLLRDDGGVINWLRWNNTTCLNSGDRTLDIGEGLKVEVRNNIFINTAFLGDDEPGSSSFQLDSSSSPQEVLISHNNFANDPFLQDAYDALNVGASVGDSVFARGFLNSTATAFVDAGGNSTTIYNELVNFVDGPATPIDYINSFYDDPANALPLDDGDGGVGPGIEQLPFDFCYESNAILDEGGVDGGRMGDLNWTSCVTSTQELDAGSINWSLFPNPFQQEVNLEFELDAPASANFQIINALGQVIYSRNERAVEGVNRYRFNLRQSPTGYYFLRVTLDDRFLTRPLMKQN
ncbi:MAG: T9SS type A sorting domain-containing protein [Bacteroidota bacterium]